MRFESIRALLRLAVNGYCLRRLSPPFVSMEGHAWSVDLPACRRMRQEEFLLYEDGQLLGPADSLSSAVALLGRGHYGWQDGQLIFSTSDNSDPNSNGRRYAFSTAAFLARRRRSLPANYSTQDASPEAIDREVERILSGVTRVLKATAGHLPSPLKTLNGARVLEVGPGCNYGWLIVVACAGAIPAAVDAYPARWDSDYHLPLFRRLRERLGKCEFVVTAEPLDTIIKGASFASIPRSGSSLEQTDYPDNAYEMVFSNAVIEHLYDSQRATEQLFRVTRPGGIGCHWVDFRDHRDFSRPLEYLLLSDEAFSREFGLRHGECGNRYRQDEIARQLTDVGFEILDFQTTFEVEADYLADFLPRLRRAIHSKYRDVDSERLRQLHGCFLVRKPE